MLLHPKRFLVKDVFGNEKEFILSLMPATAALDFQARAASVFISKSAEIAQIHELRDLLFRYVAVEIDGQTVPLVNATLIDNHVLGGVQVAGIVAYMVEYNFNFFGTAGSPGLANSLLDKAMSWIIPTLAPLLERLSQVDLPHTPS